MPSVDTIANIAPDGAIDVLRDQLTRLASQGVTRRLAIVTGSANSPYNQSREAWENGQQCIECHAALGADPLPKG
jgi:hypothetical protein